MGRRTQGWGKGGPVPAKVRWGSWSGAESPGWGRGGLTEETRKGGCQGKEWGKGNQFIIPFYSLLLGNCQCGVPLGMGWGLGSGRPQFPWLLEEDPGFVLLKPPPQSLLQRPPGLATPSTMAGGTEWTQPGRHWGRGWEGEEGFSRCTGWGQNSRQEDKVPVR